MSVKKVSIRYSTFAICSIGYLVLPVLIFLFGFLKLYYAIPFCLAFCVSAYLYIRDLNKDSLKNTLCDKRVEVSLSYLVLTFVVVLFFSVISGIGEFTWSTIDHRVRWVILKDLIDYDWPVIYDFSTQENPLVREVLGEGSAAFAYYFTFWMVPALIGKVFGLTVARVSLVIWSAIGLYLILLGIGIWEKKLGWIALVVFMLFGGLDTIPYHTELMMGIERTWEGWNEQMYIHGSYSQLMNVFHQCIPGWLVTLLILLSRNNRSIGFVGSLMFCYSPWATIGLLPIALCQLFRKSLSADTTIKKVKNIFTFNNLAVPCIILLVFATFFTANPDATSVRGFIWNFIDGGVGHILLCYVLYVVVEFGVWTLIVYKDFKKEPLLLVLFVELLVFPIYNISHLNDLLMRGSMAPMFILMVFVIHTLDKTVIEIKKNRTADGILIKYLVVLVFFLSALTQIDLLTASINFTITEGNDHEYICNQIGSFGNIGNEEETNMVDLQFLVEDYEDTFFFKYLAR